MAQIVKKYEFENESIVDSLIKNLGVDTDEYDDELNEITPPILYDKFCVDVCWNDENDNAINDWSEFEINIDNEGIHSFAGVKYISD